MLTRFDHERHVCAPNPIECQHCHGDGTGGLPAKGTMACDDCGERVLIPMYGGELTRCGACGAQFVKDSSGVHRYD